MDNFVNKLSAIKNAGNQRELRYYENKEGKYIIYGGNKLLNFSSNDYLGIASDENLINEFYSGISKYSIDKYALSNSSSRLLTGNSSLYKELERYISNLYNDKKCIVFGSGYHTNVGVISGLFEKGDIIFCDKLNHASIIDGIRLSGAKYFRYHHLDYSHLEDLLLKNRDSYNNCVIITESIFSMDGDVADLKKLVDIKQKYNSLLIVDEAHGLGVFGENGKGLSEQEGLVNDIDIITGAFGKAAACFGGYAIFPPEIYEYILSKARTLIFSTALPPVLLNWLIFILPKICDMKLKRKNLLNKAEYLRSQLIELGLETYGASQIVPIVIGDSASSVRLSNYFYDNNVLLNAIRPPTVPPNSARLRVSLTDLLDYSDIDIVLGLFIKYFNIGQ